MQEGEGKDFMPHDGAKEGEAVTSADSMADHCHEREGKEDCREAERCELLLFVSCCNFDPAFAQAVVLLIPETRKALNSASSTLIHFPSLSPAIPCTLVPLMLLRK